MSRDMYRLNDALYTRARVVEHRCRQEGFELLIYCTDRNLEQQAKAFRIGRTLRQIHFRMLTLRVRWNRPDLADLLDSVGPQYGKKVITWAAPGQSLHNYGYAFDAVPVYNGKLIWNDQEPIWQHYGDVIKSVEGLEWAGTWSRRRREFPHAQLAGIRWQQLIKKPS